MTSLVSSGDLAGGLRYAVDENCDGWVSRREDQKNVNNYWLDAYYKCWGVIVAGNDETLFNTIAFAYSVEKNLVDNIRLGSSVKLVDFMESATAYFGGWDPYVVLNI